MLSEVLDSCTVTDVPTQDFDHEIDEETRKRIEEWRTLAANLAGGFFQAPNAVQDDPMLSITAKAVYYHLLKYMWKKDWCWPSQERMAKEIGISRRTVIRACKELYERCYIEVWRRGLGKTNMYFINPLTFVASLKPALRGEGVLVQSSQMQAEPHVTRLPKPDVTASFLAVLSEVTKKDAGSDSDTQRQVPQSHAKNTKEKNIQEKNKSSSSSSGSSAHSSEKTVGDGASISGKRGGVKEERTKQSRETVEEVKDTNRCQNSNDAKDCHGVREAVQKDGSSCVQEARSRSAGTSQPPSHSPAGKEGHETVAAEPSEGEKPPARPKREIPTSIGKIAAEYARQYDDPHLIGSDVTRMKKIYATAIQVYPDLTEEQFWHKYDEAKAAAAKFAHKRHNSQGRVTRVPYLFTCLENLFSFTLEEVAYLRTDNPLYDDHTLVDFLEETVQTYNAQVMERATELDYRAWLLTALDHLEHCKEPKHRTNATYREW